MKKTKLILSAATGLMSSGSVAPLVTISSCSDREEEAIEFKYDEEFGINEFEYKTVEKQFEQLASAKIDESSVTDEEKALAKENLTLEIETFRKKLSELSQNPTATNSKYTAVSNAIIDFAENQYGIRLNRNSKIQWSNIDTLYVSLRNSWRANLQASGISGEKLEDIMNDIEANYKKLISDLTARYNDPLSAYIKAQNQLPLVFASVNSEIAYLAAGLVLKEFLSSYIIEYKEDSQDNALDQLEGSFEYDEELNRDVEFAVNNDITAFINRIFTIRNAKTGNLVPGGFTRHIIPGWRISPVLTSINHDDYKNEHSIAISWECVKDTYEIGSDEAEKATAFSVDSTTADFSMIENEDENANIADFIEANKTKRSSIEYAIPVSDENLKARLKDTFLNPNAKKESKTNDDDEQLPLKGDLHIFWKNNKGFIDGFTNNSREVFPNMVQQGHRYFQVTAYNFARSGANIRLSADPSDPSYELNDIYDNAEKLVDHDYDKASRFEVLPPVLKGFGIGCDIVATVDIWQENNEEHIAFVPGEEPKLNYVDGSLVDLDINIELHDGIKWGVQIDSWRDIIRQYNHVLSFYNEYNDNVFEKDFKNLHSELVAHEILLSITSLFDVGTIIGCFMPSSPGQKILNIIFGITSAIDMALSTASFVIFMTQRYNIARDWANRAKKVKEFDEFIEFKKQIEYDRTNFHLLDGEVKESSSSGQTIINIDEKEFLKRYREYYTKISPNDYLGLQDRYIHSESYLVLTKLKNKLSQENLDMEQYHSFLRGWEKGGKWYKITLALDISSIALIILEIGLACFSPLIKGKVDIKYPMQIREQMAKNASRHIYCRMWNWFKKLFKSEKKVKSIHGKMDWVQRAIPRPTHDFIRTSARVEGNVGRAGRVATPAEAKQVMDNLEKLPTASRSVKAKDATGKTVQAPERFFGPEVSKKYAGKATAYKGKYKNPNEFINDVLSTTAFTSAEGASTERVVSNAIRDEFIAQGKKGVDISFHRVRIKEKDPITGIETCRFENDWVNVTFETGKKAADAALLTEKAVGSVTSTTQMFDLYIQVMEKIAAKGRGAGRRIFEYLKSIGRSEKEAYAASLKTVMYWEDVANRMTENIVKRLKDVAKVTLDATTTAAEESVEVVRFIEHAA